MTAMDLGSLERFELREVWPNEAGDFTPWLSSEGGLKLLGQTLGFELQLEKTEKSVGPFNADILAKRMDIADDHWVLIENQLEKTDHVHLGQLPTYAAGLKAATIIWVASEVRDEHRAALDWLNEITSEEFEFYGLEIELWRIGQSSPAPKLNIICRPNNWQRAAKESANRGTASELNRMQLAYWTALHEKLRQPGHRVEPQKAHPQHWSSFSLGRTGAGLNATINTQKGVLGVECTLSGPLSKSWFHQLHAQQVAIEQELGGALDWRELPGKKSSRIILFKSNVEPGSETDWPNQHASFAKTLDQFAKVFRPRVAQLSGTPPSTDNADPSEDIPPE
jgi:hypothetical protein